MPLTLLGIAYTIFINSLWCCIPLIVTPSLLGTAYGLMTSLDNLGGFLSPLLVAFLKEHTSSNLGYQAVLSYFLTLAGAHLAATVYLHYVDRQWFNGVLSQSQTTTDSEFNQEEEVYMAHAKQS